MGYRTVNELRDKTRTVESHQKKDSAEAHALIATHLNPGVATGSKLFDGKPRKTYGKGRVCRIADCYVKLSMYNAEEFCYSHRTERETKIRRNTEGGGEGYGANASKR